MLKVSINENLSSIYHKDCEIFAWRGVGCTSLQDPAWLFVWGIGLGQNKDIDKILQEGKNPWERQVNTKSIILPTFHVIRLQEFAYIPFSSEEKSGVAIFILP